MKIKFALFTTFLLQNFYVFGQLKSSLTIGLLGNGFRIKTTSTTPEPVGNVQFEETRNFKTSNYALLPTFLYGISEHWQVGSAIGIQGSTTESSSSTTRPNGSFSIQTRKTNALILGAQARYVHFFTPKLGVYGWFQVDYRIEKGKSTTEYHLAPFKTTNQIREKNWGALFRPGIYWLVNKNIMLDFSMFDFQYIQLINQEVKNSNNDIASKLSSASSLSINGGLQSIEVGIHYILKLKKNEEATNLNE